MRQPLRITVSSSLSQPASLLYSILADYREGHPQIIPPAYFRNLQVEEGGYGAGTMIQFQMCLLGRIENVRGIVTEPEPGRVLVETYPATNVVTSFTVQPDATGQAAEVTITTEMNTHAGVAGMLERFLLPLLFRRIYTQELARLAAYAASHSENPRRTS